MDNLNGTVGNGAQLALKECFAPPVDNHHRTVARVITSHEISLTCTFSGSPQIQQALVRVPRDIDLYRTNPVGEKQISMKLSHPILSVFGRKAVTIGGMS